MGSEATYRFRPPFGQGAPRRRPKISICSRKRSLPSAQPLWTLSRIASRSVSASGGEIVVGRRFGDFCRPAPRRIQRMWEQPFVVESPLPKGVCRVARPAVVARLRYHPRANRIFFD